jgi:hypothetical protein
MVINLINNEKVLFQVKKSKWPFVRYELRSTH